MVGLYLQLMVIDESRDRDHNRPVQKGLAGAQNQLETRFWQWWKPHTTEAFFRSTKHTNW